MPFAIVHEPFRIRHEPLHRADEMLREVDAMREHVAEFAGAGERLHLPPAEIARAPILQPARAVMIRLAEIALRDEMRRGNASPARSDR